MKLRDQPPDSEGTGLTVPRSPSLALVVETANVPARALHGLQLFRDRAGNAWVTNGVDGRAYRLDSAPGRAFVHRLTHHNGLALKPRELSELVECLIAAAQLTEDVREVWYRVAPIDDRTVVIDLGGGPWVRIGAGTVEIVEPYGEVLFYRPSTMQPLPVPAEEGDHGLLKNYWHLPHVDMMLVRALLTYVLVHPKRPGTVYPILVVISPQGTGKSFFFRTFLLLVDPTSTEMRSFPKNPKDLALAVQKSHVIAFDNLRRIPPEMADTLCQVVSGGWIEVRKLFTDADTVAHRLHGAVLLNGLHSFVDQQDLAQRCLRINLRPIAPEQRRTERDLLDSFERDRPAIFRGLLDLAAKILAELPHAKASSLERLASFSLWLAAMERAEGVPEGVYQAAYASAVDDVMFEGLLEDPVAAAIIQLVDAQPGAAWKGTPAELLDELARIHGRAGGACEWLRNVIALRKHMATLETGLARAGYVVETGRSQRRWVSIIRQGGARHD